MTSTDSSRYSSKIIKAGALLADTKTILAQWDMTASVSENLERMRRENVLGKTSRARVETVLAAFRQRYLAQSSVIKALVVFVGKRLQASVLDRLLYFHSAQADRLLHDTVTEILLPMWNQGTLEITPLHVQRVLQTWVQSGKTSAPWSEPTTLRIARGLLSTLRDFGILQGAVRKRIAPPFLPMTACAYIAFYLKQGESSGAKVIESPGWRLFFYPERPWSGTCSKPINMVC